MKKKLAALLLALTMVLSMTACGTDVNSGVGTDASTETESVSDKQPTGDISFQVPEGYTSEEMEGIRGMWYCGEYPEDTSNINWVQSELGADGIDYDAESYKTVIQDTYKAQGLDVDVTIDKFEFITIDGVDALYVVLVYDINEIAIKQWQLTTVVGGMNNSLTCTQMGDADRAAEFEAVIDSVEIVYE